ncbi:transmembrane protein, partial [Cystoisospora suis]
DLSEPAEGEKEHVIYSVPSFAQSSPASSRAKSFFSFVSGGPVVRNDRIFSSVTSLPRRFSSFPLSRCRSSFSSLATFHDCLPHLSWVFDTPSLRSSRSHSLAIEDRPLLASSSLHRSASYPPPVFSCTSFFSSSRSTRCERGVPVALPVFYSLAGSSSLRRGYPSLSAHEEQRDQDEHSKEADVSNCQVREGSDQGEVEEQKAGRDDSEEGQVKGDQEDRDKGLFEEEEGRHFANEEEPNNRDRKESVVRVDGTDQGKHESKDFAEGEEQVPQKVRVEVDGSPRGDVESNKVETATDEEKGATEFEDTLVFPVPEEFHDLSISRPPPEIFCIFTRSPSVCSHQDSDRLTSAATLGSGEFSSCLRDLFQETVRPLSSFGHLSQPPTHRVQGGSTTATPTVSHHLAIEDKEGVTGDIIGETPRDEGKTEEGVKDKRTENVVDEGQDRLQQGEEGATVIRTTVPLPFPPPPKEDSFCLLGKGSRSGETTSRKGGQKKVYGGGGSGKGLERKQVEKKTGGERGAGREASQLSRTRLSISKQGGDDTRKKHLAAGVVGERRPLANKSTCCSSQSIGSEVSQSPLVRKTPFSRTPERAEVKQQDSCPVPALASCQVATEDPRCSRLTKKKSQSVRFLSPISKARSPYPPPRPASPPLPAVSSHVIQPSSTNSSIQSHSPSRDSGSREHPHPGILRNLLFQREHPPHETGLLNRLTERCVLYGSRSRRSCEADRRVRLCRQSLEEETEALSDVKQLPEGKRVASVQSEEEKQREDPEPTGLREEDLSPTSKVNRVTDERARVCERHIQGRSQKGQQEKEGRRFGEISQRSGVNQLLVPTISSPRDLKAPALSSSTPCSHRNSPPPSLARSGCGVLTDALLKSSFSFPSISRPNSRVVCSGRLRQERDSPIGGATASVVADSSKVASSPSASASAASVDEFVSGSEVTGRQGEVTRKPPQVSLPGESFAPVTSSGLKESKYCFPLEGSSFIPSRLSGPAPHPVSSAPRSAASTTTAAPSQDPLLTSHSRPGVMLGSSSPRQEVSPLPASVIVPLTREEAEAEHRARPRTGRRPWFCGEEYPVRRFPSWGRRSRTPPPTVSRERVLMAPISLTPRNAVERDVPRHGKSRSLLQECCNSCCPESAASSQLFSVYSGYSGQLPADAVMPSTVAGGLSPRFCYNSASGGSLSIPNIRVVSSSDTTAIPRGLSVGTENAGAAGGVLGGGGRLGGCPTTAVTHSGQAVYTQAVPGSGASSSAGMVGVIGESQGVLSPSVAEGDGSRFSATGGGYFCESASNFSTTYRDGERRHEARGSPCATVPRTYLQADPTAASSARVWRSLTPPSRVLGAAPVLSATTRLYDPDQLHVQQHQEVGRYIRYLPEELGKSASVPQSEPVTARTSYPPSAVSTASPPVPGVTRQVSGYTTTRVVASPNNTVPVGGIGTCSFVPSLPHASSTPAYPATWSVPFGSSTISASPTPSFGPWGAVDVKNGATAAVMGKTLSGVYTLDASGRKPTEGDAVSYHFSSVSPVVVHKQDSSLLGMQQHPVKQDTPVQNAHSEATGSNGKETDNSSASGLRSYASRTSNYLSPSRTSSSLQPSSPEANASPVKTSEGGAEDPFSTQKESTSVSKPADRKEERASVSAAARSLSSGFKNMPAGLSSSPPAAAAPAGAAASAGSPIYRMSSVPLGGCIKGVSPSEFPKRRNSTLSGLDSEGAGFQKRGSSLGRGLSSVRRRREGSAPGGTGVGGTGEQGVSGTRGDNGTLFQEDMVDGEYGASGRTNGEEEIGRGISQGSERTRDGPVRKAFWYRNVSNNDEDEKNDEARSWLMEDPHDHMLNTLDKLAKAQAKLDLLQQQLQQQTEEVQTYFNSYKTADAIRNSLETSLSDCNVCYARRSTQLNEVDKRLKVLTADNLGGCSTEELEELAQELEATLYKLTVVQTQRDTGVTTYSPDEPPRQLLPFSSDCLPDPKTTFVVPDEPAAMVAVDECVTLGEEIDAEFSEVLKDLRQAQQMHEAFRKEYKRIQMKVDQAVNVFDVDLRKLTGVERTLEQRLRKLLCLTGDTDYADVDEGSLQEYFRIVNYAVRRVYRQLALKEAGHGASPRSAQPQPTARGGGVWRPSSGAPGGQGAGEVPPKECTLAPYRSLARAVGDLSHTQSADSVPASLSPTRSRASPDQRRSEIHSSSGSTELGVRSPSRAVDLARAGPLRNSARGGEGASHPDSARQTSMVRTDRRLGDRPNRKVQNGGNLRVVTEDAVEAARAAALQASMVTTYPLAGDVGDRSSEDGQSAVTEDGVLQQAGRVAYSSGELGPEAGAEGVQLDTRSQGTLARAESSPTRGDKRADDAQGFSYASPGVLPRPGRKGPSPLARGSRAVALSDDGPRGGRSRLDRVPPTGNKVQEGPSLLGLQLPSARESSRDSVASSRNGRSLFSEAAQAANVSGLEWARPSPVMILPNAKRGPPSSAASLTGLASQRGGAKQLSFSPQDLAVNRVSTSSKEHDVADTGNGYGVSPGSGERPRRPEDRNATLEKYIYSDHFDSCQGSTNNLGERDGGLHRLVSPPVRLRELGATASPDALPATPSSLVLAAASSRERYEARRKGKTLSSASFQDASSNGFQERIELSRRDGEVEVGQSPGRRHTDVPRAVSEQFSTELVPASARQVRPRGESGVPVRVGRDERRSASEKLRGEEIGGRSSPGRRHKVPPQRFSVVLLRDGSISSEGGVYLPVMQEVTPRPSLSDDPLAAAEQAAFLLHQEAQRTGQSDPAAAILSSRTGSFGSSVDKNKNGRQHDLRQGGPRDGRRQSHLSSASMVSVGEGGRRRQSAALAALSASDELPGLQHGERRASRGSWSAGRRGDDFVPSPSAALLQRAELRTRGSADASEESTEGANSGASSRIHQMVQNGGSRRATRESTGWETEVDRRASGASANPESSVRVVGGRARNGDDAERTRAETGRGGSVSRGSEVFVSALSAAGRDSATELTEEE